jgi:hypothetical protein
MTKTFNVEYNETISNDSLFFFTENLFREEDDEQIDLFNDCNNDEVQETSPNNIESNQNLSQKKTSDISQEKEKEKEIIKNDEKPNIEISKIKSNENWNSDTKKEKYIENNNDKIDIKEKTQEIKELDYRFENFMKKIKTFIFKSILRYVNSFIKRPKLKKIEIKVKRDAHSKYNKDLLKTSLKDILSGNNKEIIEKKYKEKNQNVIDILNMTLKEFIDNFKRNPELKKFYDEYINKMKMEKKYSDNYIRNFEFYFDNFSEICEKRKEKKESKKEEK